jgi:hypothetical protein
MAIDVASVCSTASDSAGSQTLAIVLSVMFSLYTVVTIALSALTIYSTSQSMAPPEVPSNTGSLLRSRDATAIGASVPLVTLRSQ